MTSSSNTLPIDTATVERCIELLRGHGEYDGRLGRTMSEPTLVETWTFTTHPMDLLRGLIVTKTEAEKLVSEWREYRDPEDDYGLFGRDDMNTLAQFILDKQKRERVSAMMAAPLKCDGYSTSEEPQPQYVFGPWIIPTDGRTPDFPIGWEYQMRSAITHVENSSIQTMIGRYTAIDTHYRVRFEVGKWYDWTGGACPVGDDVRVEVVQRDDYTTTEAAGNFSKWNHTEDCWLWSTKYSDDNIIRFKITGETK